MAATNELKKIYIKQLSFEPAQDLLRLVKETKFQITDEAFAKRLDKLDELKNLREEFYYPKMKHLPLGKLYISLVSLRLYCEVISINSYGVATGLRWLSWLSTGQPCVYIISIYH